MKRSIANAISKKNRDRKYKYFKERVGFTADTKVLDVGFANHEFSPIDNYLEKHYPFRAKITALGVGGKDEFTKNYPDVETVLYMTEKFSLLPTKPSTSGGVTLLSNMSGEKTGSFYS